MTSALKTFDTYLYVAMITGHAGVPVQCHIAFSSVNQHVHFTEPAVIIMSGDALAVPRGPCSLLLYCASFCLSLAVETREDSSIC